MSSMSYVEWTRPVSGVWEQTALSKALGDYVSRERKRGHRITVRSESENNVRELQFRDGMRIIYMFNDKELKKAKRVLREESLFILPPENNDCLDRILAFPDDYRPYTSVCELNRYTREDVDKKLKELEIILDSP